MTRPKVGQIYIFLGRHQFKVIGFTEQGFIRHIDLASGAHDTYTNDVYSGLWILVEDEPNSPKEKPQEVITI